MICPNKTKKSSQKLTLSNFTSDFCVFSIRASKVALAYYMRGEKKSKKMKSQIEQKFDLNPLFRRLGTRENIFLIAIDA
jgi:hypothetical protein